MSTDSSRREFLSGQALRQQAERAGEMVADALLEAGEHRPAPAGHDTVRLETSAMACTWAVVMNPGPARQVMVASDALSIVHELEDQLTVYRNESELMRINRQAHESPQPAEAKLFALLLQCRELSEQTDGAFDPTSGPLIRLWRDCRAEGRIPTPGEVRQALEHVGIKRVTFDEVSQKIRFPEAGFGFDLGAVGKGYAIDQAVAHLRAEGVGDLLVHGGHSSLYAGGIHGPHEGWPVGIRNPLFTHQRYATILLRDRGMSTSGSNIQYFRYGGRRYGHILDPRTGWPAHSPETDESSRHAPQASLAESVADSSVGRTSKSVRNELEKDVVRRDPQQTDRLGSSSCRKQTVSGRDGDSAGTEALLSVTVLAQTAAVADALSTAFYVMGLEKARRWCHNHPQVSAILIPTPSRGRTLEPVVCNLPEEQLFFEPSVVGDPSSADPPTTGTPLTTDH